MQKFFTQKAFLLLTLLFVLIAICSFATFRETGRIGEQAHCLKLSPASGSEMLWEMVSKKFLMFIPI
jgi:hypothetical protein